MFVKDPQPLQPPQAVNHIGNTTIGHRSLSSSFVGSGLGWFRDLFFFGWQRIWWFFIWVWKVGFGYGYLWICGYFLFWFLSQNCSNMVFLLAYEWLWICIYMLCDQGFLGILGFIWLSVYVCIIILNRTHNSEILAWT